MRAFEAVRELFGRDSFSWPPWAALIAERAYAVEANLEPPAVSPGFTQYVARVWPTDARTREALRAVAEVLNVELPAT